MKYKSILIITILATWAVLISIQTAYSQDRAVEAYRGQTIIKCKGVEINIPKFNVNNTDNLFLTFPKNACNKDNFEVFVGIGADCNGSQMCYTDFFSKQKISASNVNSTLDEIFSRNLKSIKLDNNLTGYIVPVYITAYPTPLKLIWQDESYIYIIGSKGGVIEQLVESANLLISANK